MKPIDAEFDQHQVEFGEWAFDILDLSRDTQRISRSESHGGFWVITGYQDVVDVAHNPATYSNRNGIGFPAFVASEAMIPSSLDPPENIPYRRILAEPFGPAAVMKREQAVRSLVNYLIDEFVEDGKVDFYQQLGTPVAAIVTLRMLGMDATLWPRYAETSHTIWENGWIPNLPQEKLDEIGPKIFENYTWVFSTMRERVEQLRKDNLPGDSVMHHLVRGSVNGEDIPVEKLTHIIHNIYEAGLDTTASAVGCMAVRLGQDPDLRALLAREPDMIPAFIEESLRIQSPTTMLGRVAAKDCKIGEHLIREGDTVLLSFAAANRDPRVFTNPTNFELNRKPNRHVAFGVGTHRCVGSHIARLELRVVLEELLRRIPDFTVDPESLVLARDAGIVFGYLQVPGKFNPGARENKAGPELLSDPW
ncbi:cytochrome P450 [Mycobacterium sp. MMS18-G62]